MESLDLDRVRIALLADLETAGPSYRVVRGPIKHLKWPPDDALFEQAESGIQIFSRVQSGDPPFEFEETDGLELWVEDDPHPIGSLLPLGERDAAEELAHLLDHLQDDVSEHETEPWPTCPHHYHQLRPVKDGDWVVWCCPDTNDVIAPFGRLRG